MPYSGWKKFEGRRDFFKKTKGIISARNRQTVGLTSKGSVIVLGQTVLCGKKECHEYYWQNTVAITAGGFHAVGLKADGTVVATGHNEHGQCDVEYWKDIVAIAAGDHHIVGLKADGTVVAKGNNEFGQCDVEDWKLFDNIDTFVEKHCNAIKIAKERRIAGEKAAEERRIAKAKAEEERRIAEEKARQELMEKLKVEKANAENELANLHGLFTGKRRKELEAQIAEIDKKLRNLNKS